MGSATKKDEVEKDVCDRCGGSGETEKMELVTGDNLVPGGFYEGSGKFEPCEDCGGSGTI